MPSVESAMRAEPAGRDRPLRSGREGRRTAAATAVTVDRRRRIITAVGSEAAERVEYQAALKKHQQRQKANSRWDLVRTRMTSSASMSSSSPSSTSLLSYMAAAAREEVKEGEHGNTSARMRLRSEWFDKVDQKTLTALLDMGGKELKRQAVRESAGSRSGGSGGAGDVEMIMVRNPSFRKASVALAQSSPHDAADVTEAMATPNGGHRMPLRSTSSMLYEFAGEEEKGHLSVKQGDVIHLLDEHLNAHMNPGWSLVEHEATGETGYVPSAYVSTHRCTGVEGGRELNVSTEGGTGTT